MEYTKTDPLITEKYWAEGPVVTKVDDHWLVYFDKYKEHAYGAVASRDLQIWTNVSNKAESQFPERHPTWNRIDDFTNRAGYVKAGNLGFDKL